RLDFYRVEIARDTLNGDQPLLALARSVVARTGDVHRLAVGETRDLARARLHRAQQRRVTAERGDLLEALHRFARPGARGAIHVAHAAFAVDDQQCGIHRVEQATRRVEFTLLLRAVGAPASNRTLQSRRQGDVDVVRTQRIDEIVCGARGTGDEPRHVETQQHTEQHQHA